MNVYLQSVGRQKIGDGDYCRFCNKVNCKNQNRVPYLENRVRNSEGIIFLRDSFTE